MKFIKLFLFAAIFSTLLCAQENQKKEYHIASIAFYNLENLFDTINQKSVRDEDFTPEGLNRWNAERYKQKLENMSKVIAQIGDENIPINGPAIIGLSELENRSVLEDLIKHPNLKDRNYQIVHYDSPDRRGIDVALIYKPELFKVLNTKSVRLNIEGRDNFYTRDQLVVSGIFDTDTLHLIVNHWPSRSGGEKRSRPLRNAAAKLSRSIADSIFAISPKAKIIIMGDLNDDPTNKSLTQFLKAKSSPEDLKNDTDLYNPMYALYKKGIGSLAYRDSWNLFDQLIISKNLVDDKSSYHFYAAKVFNKRFLLQKEGRYKGYPNRTFAGGVYNKDGYSDHFPVYIYIVKEK